SAAVNSQRKPELQRVHATRPLHADAGIIGQRRSGSFRHVWRRYRKSALQNFWMAGENDARREGNRKPLVRIDGEGIGALDAAHQVAMFVGENRCRAVCAVHVEPERSEEHTSELQSLAYLVCRLLLEKKKTK